MSGYNGDGSPFGGQQHDNVLNGLLAQLQRQPDTQPELQPSFGYYQSTPLPSSQHFLQPSVQSIAPTPINGQQPRHVSAVMSPVDSPQPRIPSAVGGTPSNDRTSSLLNLLKFSEPTTKQPPGSAGAVSAVHEPLPVSRAPSYTMGHGKSSSGSDLISSLLGNTSATAPQSRPLATLHEAANGGPSAEAQNYLLNLLRPAKKEASPALQPATLDRVSPDQSITPDEVRHLASTLQNTSLDTEPHASKVKQTSDEPASRVPSMFTYVNPFEQLAAVSPRPASKPSTPAVQQNLIQILKRADTSDHKRKMDERSNKSSPAPNAKRRIETSSQPSSGPPTPLPDGRTQLEALIGIGAPSTNEVANTETVTEALQDVGNRVNDEVQQAIARAEQEGSESKVEHDLRKMLAARTEKEFEASATAAAVTMKKELDRDSNKDVLEDLPTPVAEYVKETINNAAQGNVVDSWESASAEDDADKTKEDEALVTIYSIPMKPFFCVMIKGKDGPVAEFRDEVITDIARLKKDFDQIDRTLVTASRQYIVYGMPSKSGGMRVIRQSDGQDFRFFDKSSDRIYSVIIADASRNAHVSILGTGVSGTVYWAEIQNGSEEFLAANAPSSKSFSLPPIPMHEAEAVGGAQKTRVCMSNRRYDLFAVGRGRNIHLIRPSMVIKHKLMNAQTRVVDIDKYLKKETLNINIGKACKDFVFSRDDSCIVSLDKTGRVKFWDVRKMLPGKAGLEPEHQDDVSIELTDPVWSLNTTPSNEKAWPTSLLFLDKPRAFFRYTAFRYMLVGTKQNHTFQLWDLGLRKVVQILNLPHENESDPICSVVFHIATSLLIIGHPTRNSIFFCHLSAPKYLLEDMSQAVYCSRLATQDTSVAKPSSTAVFSGVREYSLANKGVLRSLEILQVPTDAKAAANFELYVMHSTGVTCLNITHSDLGWDTKGGVIKQLDGEQEGFLTMQRLVPIDPEESSSEKPAAPAPSTPPALAARPLKSIDTPKEILKKPTSDVRPSIVAKEKPGKVDATPVPKVTTPGTAEAKNKNRRRKANAGTESNVSSSNAEQIPTPTSTVGEGSTKSPETNVKPVPTSKAQPDKNDPVTAGSLASDVQELLDKSFASLATTIRDDRRAQAMVAEAKQDAMLRLVSSTLSENIEATLGSIVNKSITTTVMPAITSMTSRTINDAVSAHLGTKLQAQITKAIPAELHKTLPDAIEKALQNPVLLKSMSEALARSVAFKVEEQFATILQEKVTPAFQQLTLQATQRVADEVQRQAAEQIGELERQHRHDSQKIQDLTELLTGLTRTVSAMAESQQTFQAKILEERASLRASLDEHQSKALTVVETKSPEQLESEAILKSITQAMEEGRFEQAVITWLQSGREQEFFQRYFVQYKPSFIQSLSLLLLISVGASVTSSEFGDLMHERLEWIEVVIVSVANRLASGNAEEGVQNVIPKITAIFIQRLEHLFMRVSQTHSADPILKRISHLVTTANRVLDMARKTSGYP